MMKFKRPSVGLILVAISFVCCIVGFIFYTLTFSAFRWATDRSLVTCSVLAIWLLAVLIFVGLFEEKTSWFVSIIYIVMPFLLMFSAIKLLIPSLQAIGIYFSVGGMGDVETNAIAVPRCLIGLVFYGVSLLLIVVAAFLNLRKSENARKRKVFATIGNVINKFKHKKVQKEKNPNDEK